MKFAFIADLHIKLWSDKEFTDDGIPVKLQEILNVFEDMCMYCIKHKIDNVIIGGDINDTKDVVSARSFVKLKELMDRYNTIHFTIIHGNHDSVDKEGTESAIQLLNGPENITTITEPTILYDILFLPHSNHIKDEIYKIYNECEENTIPRIMVSHFGLDEAQLSSGISRRTSIRLKDLSKFKLCLLGHYHKPQNLHYNDTQVYYVGSPIGIRRDESGEVKRFLVVDTETLAVNEIETTGYRKYYEFIIDDESDTDEIQKEIELRKNEGHYVIIKNKSKQLSQEISSVLEGTTYIDLYVPDEEIRGITSNMELTDQMKKYMEIVNLPEENIDFYFNIGKDVLSQ